MSIESRVSSVSGDSFYFYFFIPDQLTTSKFASKHIMPVGAKSVEVKVVTTQRQTISVSLLATDYNVVCMYCHHIKIM